MVLTRRGTRSGRIEDQLEQLRVYYNQRNEACACGGRNGDCSCPDDSYSGPENVDQYYKRNDSCHRHRVPDEQPKSETVTSYKRRKPINK